MNIRRFTTTIIKATDGFILTNAGDVDIKDRLFATELALGANDSEDNYIEMSLEKARPLMEQQEEARKESRIETASLRNQGVETR